jgi:hypothetical protein
MELLEQVGAGAGASAGANGGGGGEGGQHGGEGAASHRVSAGDAPERAVPHAVESCAAVMADMLVLWKSTALLPWC